MSAPTAHANPLARAPSHATLSAAGVVAGAPGLILRLEGAAVLALACAAFARIDGGWALFALLFLVPDISMLGYLADSRVGANCYNLAHSYVAPVGLAAAGFASAQHLPVAVSLIWVAHIGFDRLLGYGLKYADAFGHTHLGIVGKARI